jgi:hypothetical protein
LIIFLAVATKYEKLHIPMETPMNDEFTPPQMPGLEMPNLQQISADGAPMPMLHVEDDHEVRMSQSQLFRAAKNSIELHKMLKFVSELEGWVQAKITIAAENLEAVKNYIEYEMVSQTVMENAAPVAEMQDARSQKIAKLGRDIMNFAEKSRPKTDADMALMNKFSHVGEKLTQIGTDFGPKGLTPAEKDVVRQAQDMMRARPVEVGEGMGDVWKGLKRGAGEFWHGSPEERGSEHAEVKARWMQALREIGIEGAQASQMADRMIAQGFEPNKTQISESKKVRKQKRA